MKLLIVRHAPAVPRGTPGIPDDERPLTAEGEKKFLKAARGLVKLATRPDVLLTSPLPRARRTAEIAAAAWGDVALNEASELASGDLDDVAALLDRQPADARVAIFGHEPQLSAFLARLLQCGDDTRLEFKKGGAAEVDIAGRVAEGGQLRWFAPPGLLRDLAD